MSGARQRKRKRRKINNGLIDVDSVDISAGANYANWIAISKEKLKERETKLIQLRLEQIVNIMNQAISELAIDIPRHGDTFVVDERMIENAKAYLFLIIDKWNGIQTGRTKKAMEEFRDYFKLSKHWFDQVKKTVFGTIFWLNLFHFLYNLIVQEPDVDAKKVQFMTVLYRLFNGTIKYSNTKRQPLINGECVLNSSELHDYFFSLHSSLTVKQWIVAQSSAKQSTDKYHCNASIIVERLKEQMLAVISTPVVTSNSSDHGNVAMKTEPLSDTLRQEHQSNQPAPDLLHNQHHDAVKHAHAHSNQDEHETDHMIKQCSPPFAPLADTGNTQQTAPDLDMKIVAAECNVADNDVENASPIPTLGEPTIDTLLRLLQENMYNSAPPMNHDYNLNHNSNYHANPNVNLNYMDDPTNDLLAASTTLPPIAQSLLSAFSNYNYNNTNSNSNHNSNTSTHHTNTSAANNGYALSHTHSHLPIPFPSESQCQSQSYSHAHAAALAPSNLVIQCPSSLQDSRDLEVEHPLNIHLPVASCAHCCMNHNHNHNSNHLNNQPNPIVIQANRVCINMCNLPPATHHLSGYHGHHDATYRVNDVRYSPLGGSHRAQHPSTFQLNPHHNT